MAVSVAEYETPAVAAGSDVLTTWRAEVIVCVSTDEVLELSFASPP